jgi:MFS family permease
MGIFMINKMRRNITLLNVIYALKWFVLMLPVTVLYFKQHDLTSQQIFTLTSCYSLAVVIFEVPSGYLADLWGRKNSIVAGIGLSILGNAFFLLPGFEYFLIAEVLMGIGASFISGCDSALFYDSLQVMKKEDQFKKLIGKYRSYGNFSEAAAGLFGGFLASYAVVLTVYGRLIVLILGFITAFFLTEPERKTLDTNKGRFITLLKVVKYCLVDKKTVKWLIIFSCVLGSVTLNIAWFSQFFFKHIGLAPIYFGVVWAIIQAASGVYARFGHNYVSFLGKHKAMISLLLFIFVGYWGLSYSKNIFVGVIFVLICFAIRGVNLPVLGYYLHQEVDSDRRATVISIKSLLVRLLYSSLAPFFGYLIDKKGLQFSIRTAGTIYTVLGLIALVVIVNVMDWKNDDNKKTQNV